MYVVCMQCNMKMNEERIFGEIEQRNILLLEVEIRLNTSTRAHTMQPHKSVVKQTQCNQTSHHS